MSQQFSAGNSPSKSFISYKTQIDSSRFDQQSQLTSSEQTVHAQHTFQQDKEKLPNMSMNWSRSLSSPSPPTTSRPSSVSSVRPPLARRRNSRQEVSLANSAEISEKPLARPPSSFSKYRLLPAIGTPVPVDHLDVSKTAHIPNIVKSSSFRQPGLQQDKHLGMSQSSKSNTINDDHPKDSITQDNSVLSGRLLKLKKSPSMNADVMSIERLDLSQFDEPDEKWKRRSSTDSSHTMSKGASHKKSKSNTSDLYDGDDDDSDSKESPVSKREHSKMNHNRPKSANKKLVVIPSPDNPPSKEVLLAVKLPTDGTRHQKYFHCNETLQSIVDFAEEMADKSFEGYVLVVASAPKNVFVDLEDTIENAGLEDKTVFHLEEYEWED